MSKPYILAVGLLLSLSIAWGQPSSAGKVLLLKNRCVLEGEVFAEGDQYRIVRPAGETLVPAAQVLAACADIESAFKALASTGSSDDPAHRLAMAKWCFGNGLRTQAAAEAQAAASLRPRHAESQALAKSYGQLAQSKASYPSAAKNEIEPLSFSVEAPAECSPEMLERFTVRVQPVLMNACASCHANPSVGKFRLEKTFANSPDKRRATQINLAATLAAIDRARPASSPLLAKATVAHGGATTAPLRDRGLPAFKQLEDWVSLAAGPQQPAPIVPTAAVAQPAGTGFATGGEAKPDGQPTPASDDPFDPSEFNRKLPAQPAKKP